MFSCRLLPRLFALLWLMLQVACGEGAGGKDAPVKTVDDRFPVQVGGRVVQMQLAARLEEMQKGLMFRKSMGEDEGMLFLYPSPQQLGFWMRNTELPLDIGYFDANGELKEVYQMYPHDERSVTSRGRNLQFALEMNQGWYAKTGVRPGAKIDLKAVAEALKARGLRPADWGLR